MKNPPAFPGEEEQHKDSGYGATVRFINKYPGMTLLDYFAGQAMQGLLASPRPILDGEEVPEILKLGLVARLAYKMAVSMLEEREKHIK